MSIIGYRKNSLSFCFEGDPIFLEPFSRLLRREFPHWFLDEIPTADIFFCKYFLVGKSGCNIASPSSWDNDLISWRFVFLENEYSVVFLVFEIFYDTCCSHESCSPRSDNDNRFHEKIIGSFQKNQNRKKKKTRIFAWENGNMMNL